MILALAISAAMAAGQENLQAAHATAGASSVVVSGGKVVYRGAFGTRDLARHLPATPDTVYRIGSITKMFTAVAVMQLIEQHRLSLDAKLSEYQPSIPNAASITVRELLMHRSGIRNYLDAAIGDGRAATPTTPQAIIAEVAKVPAESAPGTTYSYSNTNYVLLGLIVEKISGESLHAYYQKHIFAPAGMRHTYTGNAPSDAPTAVGYELSQSTKPQPPGDPSWYYACGDILSTADDLARFDMALMNGKLIHRTTFEEMMAAAQPTGDNNTSYGFGITTVPFGSQTIAGHHGGLPGFEADDEMIVKDGFAVVTLGNDFHYPTGVALNAALRTYYADDFAAALREASAHVGAAPAPPTELTQRFTIFLTTLLAGKAPADGLNSQMAQALTPATVQSIDQQYTALGSLQKLEYVSSDVAGPYHRYHYIAVFANKKQPMVFVLDNDHKIAGLFNE